MSDALVLLVVGPIAASVLTLALSLRFDSVGWAVTAVTAVAHLGLSLTVLRRVVDSGRFSYAVGGYRPPTGIELVGDGVSALLLVLVSAVTLGAVTYARRGGPRSNAFYSEFLLLLAGVSGVVATGDVFNLYVFLEITGLAAYALVASGRSGEAAVASLRYLLIGTVGASLYLFGVGYLFVATGTLNMADLAERLATVGYDSTLVVAGFGLIATGLAVKTALFPLHTWQPGAYASAPDSVSAYISALVSTVAAYALARISFAVFTVEFFAVNPLARDLLLYGAAVSVVAGSTLAVMQSEIKRMLAYSSVSQFGLVVAAFGVVNETAALGGFVHLVGHAVMKGGLFLTAGVIAAETGARTTEEYRGLFRRAPVASGAFAVLAFAMVGVPPTVGFVGKWYIVVGAVESGVWTVAAVLVASTLLTLAYFARLVERMFFAGAVEPTSEPEVAVADGGDAPAGTASVGMVGTAVFAAAVALALGFAASEFAALLDPTLEVYFPP